MEERKRKKISRGVMRSHAKKLEAKINEMVDDFSDEKLNKVMALKLNYENQVKRILEADEEVANLITDEAEPEEEINEALVINDIFYEYISKMDTLIKNATSRTIKQQQSPRNSPPLSPRRQINSTEQKVKLRKLELKPFDGDILTWQTFWDHFESSVQSTQFVRNR